mmetsp:Transcript_17276/g.50190  ORF Transcript_17276/g.50190 Transcript_17276/m.50190 type:complete len:120 (+) Transcript_17276:2377-2736(+)
MPCARSGEENDREGGVRSFFLSAFARARERLASSVNGGDDIGGEREEMNGFMAFGGRGILCCAKVGRMGISKSYSWGSLKNLCKTGVISTQDYLILIQLMGRRNKNFSPLVFFFHRLTR